MNPPSYFRRGHDAKFCIPSLCVRCIGCLFMACKQVSAAEFAFYMFVVIIWRIAGGKLPEECPQLQRLMGDRILFDRKPDLELLPAVASP